MERVTAYLGLGSNVGRRQENLENAARLLPLPPGQWPRNPPAEGGDISDEDRAELVQPLRSSSVYETAPWGYPNQPNFLNCVLEVRTSLPPGPLLDRLKDLERYLGRRPGGRYGPREIDVDILLYGELILSLPDLVVPHPRLHQRAFALVPLAELSPELAHPGLGRTIQQLCAGVDGKEGVRLWGPPLRLAAPDRPASIW